MHPPLGRFHLDQTFHDRTAGRLRGTLLVNSLYIDGLMARRTPYNSPLQCELEAVFALG